MTSTMSGRELSSPLVEDSEVEKYSDMGPLGTSPAKPIAAITEMPATPTIFKSG